MAAAMLAARGLSSLLYGLQPYDATTFGATGVLVTTMSVVLTSICAAGALRIEPIAVLRHDA